jgi:hypothetical protein
VYVKNPDAPKPMPMGNKELLPVLQIPAEVFKNPLLAPVRRADRFSKMTLLAALEAWQGAEADLSRVGIDCYNRPTSKIFDPLLFPAK